MRATISFHYEDSPDPQAGYPPQHRYLMSNHFTADEIKEILVLIEVVWQRSKYRNHGRELPPIPTREESENAMYTTYQVGTLPDGRVFHYLGKPGSPVPERAVPESTVPVNVPTSDSAVLLLPATATAPAESDSSG